MSALAAVAIALGAGATAPALRTLAHTPAVALRHRGPSREAPAVPAQLEWIERLIGGCATAADAHRLARPLLRELAAARLLRVGLSLDCPAHAQRARELLGEELWELVRPERPVPRDRLGPGLTRASLSRMIDVLEAM